jgi:hypothetical protein
MIVYWEGACDVTGRRGEKDVKGFAYAELVCYDLSDENPSVSEFLLGFSIERRWRSIFS